MPKESILTVNVGDVIEIGYSGRMPIENISRLPTGDLEVWCMRRHPYAAARYTMAETALVEIVSRATDR